ncbi:MAG: BamA/OMP85 family outer membrane protein [Armatimonadota bacterium]
MKRFTAIFVMLTTCIIGSPLAGLTQTPAPAPKTVRAVEVQGYQSIANEVQDEVAKLLKTQVGQPYDEKIAEEDKEEILHTGWFYNAFYRTEAMEDGVRVIFTVVENPVLKKISFTGNSVLPAEKLMAVLKTQPNQVLNQEMVAADAGRIRQAYAEKGYTLVQIVNLNVTPEKELQFQLFEPKIGEVRIETDNKALRTKDYVIRRELLFKVGDVYNENDIRDSLRSLDRLGIFQEVKALPMPGTEPGTLLINIQVVERRTGLASVGVGHSNIKGLIGFVDVADTNFWGSGQKLNLRVQFGADDSYELGYTNPWIGTRRTSFTANVYNRTILRQAVSEDTTHLYDEERTGGNMTLGRPLSKDRNTRGYVTLRADRVRATEEEDNPLPPGLEGLLEPSDVRSLGLSLVRDTRDNFLNPSGGHYTTFAGEIAGLGGASFNKFTAEHRRYWIIRNKPEPGADARKKQPWIFASRLSVGTITGNAPFLDQFLAGGADSLRGYKEDRFPGVNQVMLNSELRVPINESLQAVGFVDLGDAWGGRFAEGFGDPEFKLHTGYGLGVRVQTPIGPLRLDYALNGEGGREFHFGIGSTF